MRTLQMLGEDHRVSIVPKSYLFRLVPEGSQVVLSPCMITLFCGVTYTRLVLKAVCLSTNLDIRWKFTRVNVTNRTHVTKPLEA